MQEFHIQWHITSRCNLKCRHCYQDDFTGSEELNWPQLKLVCDNVLEAMRKENKRLTIALTGGEPFLKKELWDIIDYLSNSPHVLNISIITNGTIIDENISKAPGYPLLGEIYVSLDGVDAGTNDDIRGKGSFDKTMRNIERLRSCGFSVFIMYTLLNRNINEAEKLLDFCKYLDVNGFILERFIPLGHGRKFKEELITVQQLNGLYKTIFSQCGVDYDEEKGAAYHALKVELDPGDKNSRELFGAECIVAKDGCALLPDGRVLPCRRFFYPLGNLLKDSLADIWRDSSVLNELRDRKKLKGACRECKIKECRGCRALAHSLTGDYLSEDPLCRLILQR